MVEIEGGNTLVNHQVIQFPGGIRTVGGGVQSFAFGPIFATSAAILLPWSDMAASGGTERCPAPLKPTYIREKGEVPCLVVSKLNSKFVKTALERGGIFRKEWRIAPIVSDPDLRAIPLARDAWGEISLLMSDPRPERVPMSQGVTKFLQALEGPLKEFVIRTSQECLSRSAAARASRINRLWDALEELIGQRGLSRHLLQIATDMHCYEVVGDFLLIDQQAFGDDWDDCREQLWQTLIQVFGVKKLAGRATIRAGSKRESQVLLNRLR